jgi:hypothetical protein
MFSALVIIHSEYIDCSWSFGVLLFEIFSLGQIPYEGISDKELVALLQKGKRLEKPNFANDEMYVISYQEKLETFSCKNGDHQAWGAVS